MKVASWPSRRACLSVPDLFQNSSLESIASESMTEASANTTYDWEAETDLESDIVLTGCTGLVLESG